MKSLKDKIANIKYEVKEFHPLLDSVFRKMTTLKSVMYTHGPNEKGADFILTKESEELGDTEYIGIIAKVGKITQSFLTVQEQIDECTMKRFSCNGKKEIYLSEVWVVTNGSISENAKEKIHDKFRAQKIKFVDLNSLLNLTEKYFPDYGVDINIGDLNCLSQQREFCAQREQKFNLLPNGVEHCYIKQEIIKINNDFSKEYIVDIFKEIEKKNFLSIESQMGGGKTKLLNNIVSHFSNSEVYKNKRILPIYIGSKEIICSKQNLIEFVGCKIADYKLDDNKERQCLLLVDGIDETKPNEIDILNRLVSLINESQTCTNIKFVIASRTISNDILESNEIFVNNRYKINPLKLNEMIKFLEILCENIDLKVRLIEDLKQSDLFKVLPKTPIAAIILAELLADSSEELPMNLTELYSKYCELSLGRWDIEKGIQTQKQFKALDALVSLIAEDMMDNNSSSLSKEKASNIFETYLSVRNLELDSTKLFNDMLERSGILVEDIVHDTISFKHRSFAEFFYAKNLKTKQRVNIDDMIFHPYWTNTYFFYVGLIPDCPELLNEIINIPTSHEGCRISKLLNLGDFLLAGYQTPYYIIEKGIKDVFVDIGKYYYEIMYESKHSILRKLPPVYLLMAFVNMLEHNYQFKFFEKAIQNSKLEVMTSPKKCDSILYSLFFLNSIKFESDANTSFEMMAKSCGDKLPLIIQIAIAPQSKQLKYDSLAIKKLKKKIGRKMKKSPTFRNEVNKLYKQSINGKIYFDEQQVNKAKKRN